MKGSVKAALLAATLVVGLLPASPASADVRRSNFRRVGGVQSSTGGHIVFEQDRLYMGTYGTGFRVFDISTPTAPRLIGRYEPGTPRADAVPDAAFWDGRHIAVLGGTSRVSGSVPQLTTVRTEIVDMTNPATPQLLHAYVAGQDGESHNVDFHDGRRLMFSSGGSGDNGLRIYNVQPVLENPPDPNGANPANDPIRLWPPDSCRTDAAVFCDPKTLWENSPFRQGRPVGAAFTHTHDITIYPNYQVMQANGQFAPRDIILLAEGGNYTGAGNTGSTFVIDVTDPTNPLVLYRWLHESGPGHHPIRYHHEAIFLEGDPHVMLTSDEDLHNGCGGAGGVVAVRMNDTLTDSVELSEWYTPAGTPAPNCSAHVMSNVNNLMFMGAYNAGVQAIDFSNPRKPAQVGEWIGEGSNTWGAYYHPVNGYVYAGDFGGRGLDVLQYLGPGAEKAGRGSGLRKCRGLTKRAGTHIVGTNASDVLRGTKGPDVICGMGGKDRITALGGKDIVLGGGGSDRLSGGSGKDLVRGGGKADRISGGGSRDRCWGGPANDRTRSCEAGDPSTG